MRTFVVEAAYGAGRTKETYLGAQYRRFVARRGRKKAAAAVGHSILVIVYYLLRQNSAYQDLSPHFFDERDHEGVKRRLIRRVEDLGYDVTVKHGPAAHKRSGMVEHRTGLLPLRAKERDFHRSTAKAHHAHPCIHQIRDTELNPTIETSNGGLRGQFPIW